MRHSALVRTIALASVLALFGCSKTATSPESATSGSGNPDTNSSENSTSSRSSNGQKPDESPLTHLFSPKPIELAAGTEIEVTADQSVSSKTSNEGDHFDASVAAPVVVGDKVVIPKGARATGTVTGAKSAGKFKGNAEIGVTLSSVNVNGEDYEVNTSEVVESGKGRGKRTAVGAGGGAVVGALIGALAGGGKGAAIGAGVGAGGGTAGAAFTGARDITIRAESRLSFRLRDPIEIKQR